MKLKRGPGYRRGRIEIIPMIDVMFFLLVTFMLASLAMQSLNSVTVNLPKSQAEAIKHKEPVTLTVTQDKKLFLDKTPVTIDTLAFALKPMLQGQDQGSS
jgi:biopolymer transport protein ExbD